jgi:signal transduction histidine kinase
MFLWIRDQKWLPTIYLSLIALAVFGISDFLLQGPDTLIATLLLVGSVAFSRPLPWLSIALFSAGILTPQYLHLDPQLSQLLATFSLLVLAAYGTKLQRRIGYALNVAAGIASFVWLIITLPVGGSFYGIELPTLESKYVIFTAGFVAMIAVNANAWFFGRLLITRITHVGTNFDRAILEREIATTQLSLAEQDRRFEIARDVNDLLLERVSATLTSAEAGMYAAKSDPSVAPRILENIFDGVKKAHAEIRRLSDLLGLQDVKALALPGLRDLPKIFVSYREFGYGVNYRLTGEPLSLDDGAELVLYRIVFDSLENIRQHTPQGTEVDIDFIWQGNAMQVVIKDNGEETRNRIETAISGYTVEEDHRALVERPTGANLNALQERAALYEGSIEFGKVPGVGFTVSAAFPNIAKYRKATN